MQSAALLAFQGRQNDQFGDESDISEFDQIRRHAKIPIVFLDLFPKQFNARLRPLESLDRADNADIIGHRATHLVPVLRDDDLFIAVTRSSRVPIGKISGDVAQLFQ